MEALLRKYLWILDLLAVGVCAIFLGRAASSFVESKFLASIPVPKPAPRVARADSAPTYSKEIVPILKRNMFCSTCPPILPEEKKPDDGPPPDPEPVRTTLPIALVAVIYAPPPYGFKNSIAILRDNDNKEPGAYKYGYKIRGATITEIEESRVYLDNDGKPEYVDLLETEAPAAPTPVAAAPTPAAASDPLSAELDKGIKKTGEHTYELQRQTLESVLGNMALLSRSARIVPEIRDGKAFGFRLYSVRPDGPFAKIGMSNGDVISSINGLEISSPEKALEVYAKLKSASHLAVGLERNGQKISKDYTIR